MAAVSIANKPANSNYRGSERFMMFSTCYCWSRTPPGKGGWMRTTQRDWTPAMITESTKWRLFETARSMRENQNQAIIYRGFTTWFHENIIRKKKIPGSQLQLFSTFRKLISSFHKDHPEKPTATSLAINTVPPMAQPTIRPTAEPTKQKRGQPANSTNKRAKKS